MDFAAAAAAKLVVLVVGGVLKLLLNDLRFVSSCEFFPERDFLPVSRPKISSAIDAMLR